MLCPNCGSFIPAGEPYCPSCGAGGGRYEEEIIYVECPHCHNKVDEKSIRNNRCPKCDKIIECPICSKLLTEDVYLRDLEYALERYKDFFEYKLQNSTSNLYDYFNLDVYDIQALFYTDFIEECPICGGHLTWSLYGSNRPYDYIQWKIYSPLVNNYTKQERTFYVDDYSEISYSDYTAILNKIIKKIPGFSEYIIFNGLDEYDYFGLKKTKDEILESFRNNDSIPEKIVNRIIEHFVLYGKFSRLPPYVEHDNKFYFKESYVYMVREVYDYEEKHNRSPEKIKFIIVNNHILRETEAVLNVERFNTNAIILQILAYIQLEQYDEAKSWLESLFVKPLHEDKRVELENIYSRLVTIMEYRNEYQDLSLQKRLFEELEKQDFRTALVIVGQLLKKERNEDYIFKALDAIRNHYLRMYQLQIDLGYEENANEFVFEFLYVIPNDKAFLLGLLEIEKRRGNAEKINDLEKTLNTLQ